METVAEKPIIFSAPMVRAILDGRKTQTRRIVRPQPEAQHDGEPYWYVGGYRVWGYRPASAVPLRAGGNPLPCPYGHPGDWLWVRETWTDTTDLFVKETAFLHYRADYPEGHPFAWRPSIHMPRWASRILLEVADVRVERLQAISESDALAEGITSLRNPEWDKRHFPAWRSSFDQAIAKAEKPPLGPLPSAVYQALWQDIHGPDSWDGNLWVWVVEFRVLQPTPKDSV
jgi:hypothetical protein